MRVRAAALAGQGIIWQPTFMVGDDVRKGRLVPLLPGYHLPEIEVLALFPSRSHLSAKVRVMVDFLVEAFEGIPPWDRQEGPLEPANVDLVRTSSKRPSGDGAPIGRRGRVAAEASRER
jgi:hypothetical protein